MEKPIVVHGVYDNGGETVDRYSIHAVFSKNEQYLFCSSPNPFHPLSGVWSTADSGNKWEVGEHLGKQIDWNELPEDVQRAVIQYVS